MGANTNLGPKLHPGGGLFWTMIFYNVKNSHQDLSNEVSNVILISIEVELLKQPIFDKLPEITDFGLLQQSQNGARF